MSAGRDLDVDDHFPSPALVAIDRARSMPQNLSVKAKALRGNN